ncbi:MAG TPA: nucleoside-diphosphate sugar epimerase/dehydratase [Pyrinomonadaceae bacterium]|nr:nucleoside-diphosphate sugar epimerase/dehydratase [Pyrinomonadaceae bacterium]
MKQKEEPESSKFWFLRRPFQFLADVLVLSAAFFIAYLPAINMRLGEFYADTALRQLPLVVLVQLSALFVVGAYSLIWRYVSIEDIKVFIKAAVISLAVLLLLRFALSYSYFDLWQIPVSVVLIDMMMAFGGLLALRILRRFFYELDEKNRLTAGRKRGKRKPTLIVGAGRMGATLVKEIQGRADSDFDVRGFVDDDTRKIGGSVNRVKVIGGTDRLPKLVHELDIKQVVLAIDHANGKDIRRIMDICSSIPVKAQIVPSLEEIAHGRVNVTRLRDVEIEDLLGREPVELDDKNLGDLLSGRTVMVTGAGGSIGSELVRQISNYQPKKVLLVERSEYMLFEIGREVAKTFDELEFIPLIADISDEPRMRGIFAEYRPEVIFHAAAHKHVPLMEQNPVEAIKNNVLATRLVGSLAGEFNANAFVMISTDKAVNPTSVMGASKRIAEIVVQDLNQTYETKFVAVRFGNVLGSAGSVVPIFREQIEKGEPITVTHPEMTRYFMTIPEASQLVLQAGALALDGGEIFILDMGRPVKILDLAEDMIRLSGLVPYEDIDIQFTGIRDGEKLFEELEITGEHLLKTRHPKIFIGKIAEFSRMQVKAIIDEFSAAVNENSESRIRSAFNEFLPEATVLQTDTPAGQRQAEIADPSGSPAKLKLADKPT